MHDSSRINDLFERWQELYDQGEDVPARELCRDCQKLEAELEKLITASGVPYESYAAHTRRLIGALDER